MSTVVVARGHREAMMFQAVHAITTPARLPSTHVQSSRYSYIVPTVRATEMTATTTVIATTIASCTTVRSRRRHATIAARMKGNKRSGHNVVCRSVVSPPKLPMRRVPVIQSGTAAN